MKKLLAILILALTTSAWGYDVHLNLSTSDAPDSATFYWYVNGAINDSVKSLNPAGGGGWGFTQRYFDTNWTQTDVCTRCWYLARVYYSGYTDFVTEYYDQGINDTLWAILDSLQNQDNWVAGSTILGNVRDTVNAIMDTLQNQDNWVATASMLTNVRDTVNGIMDTLQNQDNWVASAAILANARDSINAILDTLQLWDDDIALLVAMRDSINAILDTLQLQDGWVMAKTDSVTVDMSNFNTSLDNDTSLVNFLRAGIGSASNAEVLDSLGKILDSLYASATISDIIDSFLARDAFWDSVNANAGTASVDTMSIWRQVWRALPTGFADSTGYIAQLLHDTLMALMDSIQNHDNWVAQQTEVANINGWNPSTDSVNVDVSAAIASNNLVGKIAAHTADSTLDEDTTGHYTFPNFAYTASQTAASSFNPATDSVVIDISKLLSTLTGQTLTLGRFVVTGANGANPTVLFENTSVSGGPAFMVDASSDAYGAVNVLNDGTGQAILLTADTGMGFNVGYTAFSPNIFTGYHFTAAYYDSITAAAGGSSNWSDAQRDSVLAVVADAGKIGRIRDSVNAILDSLQLYDGRWSTLDSATLSRITKRAIWGIATGSGSDSSTVAQRLITILDGGITGAKIADNAIGSTELAANAITSAEIAANAITSTALDLTAINEIVDSVWSNVSRSLTDSVNAKARVVTIADNAITTGAINNSAITIDDIAIGAFSGSKFTDSYYDSIQARAGSGTTDTTLIKTLATNNPSLFYGPTSSGSGVDTVHILALDTTGTDTALYNAKIVVKTMAGAVEGNLFTESGGRALFTLTTGDTFTVWGYKAGYGFDIDTIVVSAGMTDTAFAYNATIGTPSSADLCRTYLWAYDPQGSPIAGAVLTAILQGNRVQDTCNNTVIVKYENVSSGSDATGYLYLDLTKSKCLSSQNKYDFKLTYPSGETVNIGKITVPDSSTYRLDW